MRVASASLDNAHQSHSHNFDRPSDDFGLLGNINYVTVGANDMEAWVKKDGRCESRSKLSYLMSNLRREKRVLPLAMLTLIESI